MIKIQINFFTFYYIFVFWKSIINSFIIPFFMSVYIKLLRFLGQMLFEINGAVFIIQLILLYLIILLELCPILLNLIQIVCNIYDIRHSFLVFQS